MISGNSTASATAVKWANIPRWLGLLYGGTTTRASLDLGHLVGEGDRFSRVVRPGPDNHRYPTGNQPTEVGVEFNLFVVGQGWRLPGRPPDDETVVTGLQQVLS